MSTTNNTVAEKMVDDSTLRQALHAMKRCRHEGGNAAWDLYIRRVEVALASPAPSAGVGVEDKAHALADELKLASEQEDDLSASIAYADASGRVRTLAAAISGVRVDDAMVMSILDAGASGTWGGKFIGSIPAATAALTAALAGKDGA